MKKHKRIIIYVSLFFAYLFLTMIVIQLRNDEIWGYGFSHNIYKGLIPYKDFNMVITPFFPFMMSLAFHIFGSSMLVFHIENAILLVILTHIIYELIGEKIYIFGIPVLIFSGSILFPGYNLFLLFLIMLLIYLEKKKSNDYLIGFLLGISVLTKQSVGLFFLFPSLFYIKNKKKIVHRIIGFVIPCLLFLLFLLVNKNLYVFLDLCLFGLFDFGSKNTPVSYLGYIALVIYLAIIVYQIWKDHKNINNYYLLAFASIMIPLVDVHHCAIAFTALFVLLFMKYDIHTRLNFKIILGTSFLIISFISIYRYNEGYKIIYPNDIKHFEHRFIRSDSLEFTHKVLDYMKQNKDRDFVFLTSGAYYYRLASDTPMSYLDMTNNGNYGYHGSEKIMKDIEKRHDAIFFVFEEELGDYCQSDKPSMQYVIDHGNKIGSIMIYDIYVLE